jgi:hypothetical protein
MNLNSDNRTLEKAREVLNEAIKYDRKKYIIFILFVIFSILVAILSIENKIMSNILVGISSMFGGALVSKYLSLPSKLEELNESHKNEHLISLFENKIKEIIPTLSEEYHKYVMDKDVLPCPHIDNERDYKVKLIDSALYKNSKKILENKNFNYIKILMRAREFNLNEKHKGSNEMQWFTYLNNYVQSAGRKYIRVIAIDPKSIAELEQDFEWINILLEILKENNIKHVEIALVVKEVTISTVILDSETVFLAFTTDNSFPNFITIQATDINNTFLIDDINTWFDKTYNADRYEIIYRQKEIKNKKIDEIKEQLIQKLT